jgi:hypothetical protein
MSLNFIQNIEYHCDKYSYTYLKLSNIIPNQTKSMTHLNKLVQNNINNIKNCCNADCTNNICTNKCIYYAFDGFYCSIKCREVAYCYISKYWSKI